MNPPPEIKVWLIVTVILVILILLALVITIGICVYRSKDLEEEP